MRIQRLLVFLILSFGLWGQEPLSLQEAVRQALTHHPSMEAATARIHAAESRIAEARSGWLPHATYTESYQSGNNPAYVFSALLTQHQFTEGNFDIASLNRPAPLNNFQSLVSADQIVYDFGATRGAVRSAGLGKQMSEEDKRRTELALIAAVARTYHGVTLAEQGLQLAVQSLMSAQTDLERARTLQKAGMATDADVLSVQVHAAAMEEFRVRREADLRIARAALNEALGLPLDTEHSLTTPVHVSPPEQTSAAELERLAATQRPETNSARLGLELAAAQVATAKSHYWPVIALHGSFEADRQEFANKGGGNWMFMASARWNFLDGNHTRASVAEARHMQEAAAANQKQVDAAVRLETRQAEANLRASRQRVTVTEDVVAQADESLRIIRNRYSNGLATVTDLLRSETSLLEAKTRRLAALYDLRVAAVQLAAASGSLNGDSDVLK